MKNCTNFFFLGALNFCVACSSSYSPYSVKPEVVGEPTIPADRYVERMHPILAQVKPEQDYRFATKWCEPLDQLNDTQRTLVGRLKEFAKEKFHSLLGEQREFLTREISTLPLFQSAVESIKIPKVETP